MEKIHYSIRVKGRVQGVWFRKFAKDLADRTRVSGFVRNQTDGSVFVEAEGTEAALQIFLKGLEEGPRNARVDLVNYEQGPLKGFDSFVISR